MNGLSMTRTCDDTLRRDVVTAMNGSTTLQAADYDYDTAGRLWKVREGSRGRRAPAAPTLLRTSGEV